MSIKKLTMVCGCSHRNRCLNVERSEGTLSLPSPHSALLNAGLTVGHLLLLLLLHVLLVVVVEAMRMLLILVDVVVTRWSRDLTSELPRLMSWKLVLLCLPAVAYAVVDDQFGFGDCPGNYNSVSSPIIRHKQSIFGKTFIRFIVCNIALGRRFY